MNYLHAHNMVAVILLSLFSAYSTVLVAEQDKDNNKNGGLGVSVSLRHRIIIPKLLYFRIGAEVAITKVTFDLANNAAFNPSGIGNNHTYNGSNSLGNSAPVSATSNGSLFVDLRSNVGTVTLSYTIDNTNGLADGAGNFIAYDQISTTSDDIGLSAPILINAASNTSTINGNFFANRVIKRTANWVYAYKNEQMPISGTYNGQVTYTASAP